MLRFLLVVSSVALITAAANAQGVCPSGTASNKLVCLIPQVYGVSAFDVKNPDPTDGNGVFQKSFLTGSLSSVQASLARESAQLPLASPSSGVVFSWDAAAKVFTAATDSLGPVISDRADTIGKHKFFLGFSYQYFNFDKIDGQNMKKLPVVLPQADDSDSVSGRTCSITGDRLTDCGFIRDVITTDNRINLKVHQFTTYMSFGITNRLDVSVAIPISNVRMGVFSTATVKHNDSPTRWRHAFPPSTNCPLTVSNPNTPSDNSCLVAPFSNVNTASGIGDITIRVKATPWKGEHAAVATGMDFRIPSGDELNFLGTGTFTFRPFVVWSYRARVSPHAFVGYEVSGNTQLVDIAATKKSQLPSQFLYSVGADMWLTKHVTAAADIVGQEVFQSPRTVPSTFQEPGVCPDDPNNGTQCASEPASPGPIDNTLVSTSGSYNMTSLSVGMKFKPISTFLITGNVLIRLNDAGLHYKPAPMIGISYTF